MIYCPKCHTKYFHSPHPESMRGEVQCYACGTNLLFIEGVLEIQDEVVIDHGELDSLLYLSKKHILDSLVSVYGRKSSEVKEHVYCQLCGLKVFGKGSLFRMPMWEDICKCVRNGLDDIATSEEDCLFIWDEVEL